MIKKIFRKINEKIFFFKPKIKKKNFTIKHIGTTYGGYDICVDLINNPVIVSCGLGEDASFDIDMINNYNAKVICVDPTPRAIKYFDSIKKHFGQDKQKNYNESGKIEIESYNLKKINSENFILIDKAIWSIGNQELKLFYPDNKNYVSLSINEKTGYKQKKYFLSKTISFNEIINEKKLAKVDILKLDIEGAELNVIERLLTDHEKFKLPEQLIVEFDIRRRPDLNSFLKLKKLHRKIEKFYDLIYINNKGDFTYLKISGE